MNSLRLLLLFSCLIACLTKSIAQEQDVPFQKDLFAAKKSRFKSAMASIRTGDGYIEIDNDHRTALRHYMRAHRFNPQSAELNFKIGVCHLQGSQPDLPEAIKFMQSAYDLAPKEAGERQFALAKAYHLNMQWNEAITHYQGYLQQLDTSALALLEKEVKKKIEECQHGKELSKEKKRVVIESLGNSVNSKFPDIGPVVSPDETTLYFTSRRDRSANFDLDQDGHYFEDIYMATKVADNWSRVKNLGADLNSTGHDAVCSISADGKKLILYRGVNKGDIFISEIGRKSLTRAVPFPSPINSKHRETSAAFSADGKTLYLTSDRPDESLGGLDIMYAVKGLEGQWRAPRNAGEVLNTPYDEDGVFLHPNGKELYFSSKGHNSIGGYDIFKSEWIDGKWSKPENLGLPINTPGDDIFLSVSENGRRIYFSSKRDDTRGGYDLYMANIMGKEKKNMLSPDLSLLSYSQAAKSFGNLQPLMVPLSAEPITIFKGTIADDQGNPLAARFTLIDHQTGEVVASFISSKEDGNFQLNIPTDRNVGLTVKANGYLFHSENFSAQTNATRQVVAKEIVLPKVSAGSKITLNNIFFDSDKTEIKPESAVELQNLAALMKEYPKIKVEIEGHTDNTGTERYNNELSTQRAKEVVEHLVALGIDRRRLSYKGYGMSQPVASNQTEEGRQRNRRTTFRILE